MAQFDTMHSCINTCIEKRKLEFPRKKLELQYVGIVVYICVAIGDQVMKRGSYEAINRSNPANCCTSSKSELYFQRYVRFAVQE
jgi:hypothetical protein